MRPDIKRYLALASAIVLIDQITKFAIKESMAPGQSVAVFGDLLKFTFIYNDGGAFGIRFGNRIFHMLMSLIAATAITFYVMKTPHGGLLPRLLLSCIIGGAVGNFVDRIFSGSVVDFIDVNIPDIAIPPFDIFGWRFPGYDLYRWYTFNVADMAVSLGLIGYMLFLAFDGRTGRNPRIAQDESGGQRPPIAPSPQ